jgi:hypothetical protein
MQINSHCTSKKLFPMLKKTINPTFFSRSWMFVFFLLHLVYNGFSQSSNIVFPGANEKTPARSQFFSWINNTNEGTTEKQSLSNLDFFQYLRDEYGMVLDIYAFDAGAIDGAGYYGSIYSPKFKAQFPNGLLGLANKAGKMGTRLGVWGGPDGFGNTPEEEKRRQEMMISLCRDYGFELFKFDAVCGDLRNDKQDAFIKMMTESRKYNPNLILLNHRINLGAEAIKHSTTSLLGGAETYIDVHMTNNQTATHHRAGALSRRLVPGLQRLTEDHGVCLSSCLDYWEDDLVLQAFNRNLILAPEIYGNPWFLRDDEYPKLARIFNLTRKYKEILVNGIVLPEEKYGQKAVSRGDEKMRLITLRNLTWEPVSITVKLDEEIGLGDGAMVELRQYHPVEKIIGRYQKGQTVQIEVLPFRSTLLLASYAKISEPTIEGSDYEIVRDVTGKPLKINLLGFPGEKKNITFNHAGHSFLKAMMDGKPVKQLLEGKPLEIIFPGTSPKEKYHRKLGDMTSIPLPDDAEGLYEATCFAADNNALEARSILRSGPTKIPQVQKARDAFFNQPLFVDRGLWDRNLFDGNLKTSFYPSRRQGRTDLRINGGAFRLDLGALTPLDSIKIIVGDEQALQPFKSFEAIRVQTSVDLKTWSPILLLAGKEMVLQLDKSKPIRYVRFPNSPEKILEIEGFLNGKAVKRSLWRASNLFSAYRSMTAKAAFQHSFVLNEIPKGSYLAVALNGQHGIEGAYAALRVNGKLVGAPDRSLSYRSNAWEYPVPMVESNYTYYFPLTEDMKGSTIDAVVMVMKDGMAKFNPAVWITAYPIPYEKKELILY